MPPADMDPHGRVRSYRRRFQPTFYVISQRRGCIHKKQFFGTGLGFLGEVLTGFTHGFIRRHRLVMFKKTPILRFPIFGPPFLRDIVGKPRLGISSR